MLNLRVFKYINISLFIFRSPGVALNGDGRIHVTKCTCPVKNLGKCHHVAALMYLIEEMKYVKNEGNPRLAKPTTSQEQYFNR